MNTIPNPDAEEAFEAWGAGPAPADLVLLAAEIGNARMSSAQINALLRLHWLAGHAAATTSSRAEVERLRALGETEHLAAINTILKIQELERALKQVRSPLMELAPAYDIADEAVKLIDAALGGADDD